MNSEDYLGWIYLGGGLELPNELLQKELKMNVVVFPTSARRRSRKAGSRKPIKSPADLKGLKYHATGIAAEVFREMGMSVVSVAPGEIVPSLERGVVDAAEFGDPSAGHGDRAAPSSQVL